MKRCFELSPFEEELKNWYLNHQALMPWDLFLLKEKEIRRKNDINLLPYSAIDPCCRNFENAVYDKNHGFVDFRSLPFLVSGQFCMLLKQPRYFPEIIFDSPAAYIFYSYSGESEVILSDDNSRTVYHLKEGDFLLTPSNVKKTILCNTDSSIILYLALSTDLLRLAASDELPSVLLRGMAADSFHYQADVLCYETGDDPRINALIEDMIRESMEQKENYHQIVFHLLQILMIYLQREYKNKLQSSGVSGYFYIPEFQLYVRNHFSDFSLKQMANEFHLSPAYICRLYKQHMGSTILTYLQDIRIQIAEYLLKNTKDSVESIALHVGYMDSSYFIGLFKRIKGITPYRYRLYAGRSEEDNINLRLK